MLAAMQETCSGNPWCIQDEQPISHSRIAQMIDESHGAWIGRNEHVSEAVLVCLLSQDTRSGHLAGICD